MSLSRFHVAELAPGRVMLSADESHHARVTLRLRAGDAIRLFDGYGQVGDGIIADDDGGAARRPRHTPVAVTVSNVATVPPPTPPLTLCVAGCKGPRLSWLVEKCTELGVARLCFTEFARSVVHVSAGHADKLRRIALEACKQCGRAWRPEITCGLRLTDVIAAPTSRLVVAHVDETRDPTAAYDSTPSLGRWLAQTPPAATAIVIGPEGGLTADEVSLLRNVGAALVSLGPHTLRVETAALAAAATWATCAATAL
jgi:16S rRNA (uracil1498-N3)-methyltransferase